MGYFLTESFGTALFTALISTFLVTGTFYICRVFINIYKNIKNINKANDIVVSKTITYMFSHKTFDNLVLESIVEGTARNVGVKTEKMHTIPEFRSVIISHLVENLTFKNEEKQSIINEILTVAKEEARIYNDAEEFDVHKISIIALNENLRSDGSPLKIKKWVYALMITYLYAIILLFVLYLSKNSLNVGFDLILDGSPLFAIIASLLGALTAVLTSTIVTITKAKKNN